MLVDLANKGLTGKEAEEALDKAGITVNKNAIPYDERPPTITSGMRLGTPCVTTRGMGEAEMTDIAEIIDEVLKNNSDEAKMGRLKQKAGEICKRFPIY
ncbi:MAG: serine hydroxymethyltransferase, partial [Nitrospirota bacterium]|nr:serine hydroxymethyltransferase [Nitrospirota bacterium]